MSLFPVRQAGVAGTLLLEAPDGHDAIARGASVVADIDGFSCLCTACADVSADAPRPPCVPEDAAPSGRFLRLATKDDLARSASNLKLADLALAAFDEGVARLPRPPHAITASFDLPRTRLFIGFKAERRFDPRQVVERLRRRFGTEVEARQLTDREVAAATGSIGPCGRAVCCASWLRGARDMNINLRDAKQQRLSLDPTRINGCCGRFKCCIQFEASREPPRAADDTDKDKQP